MRAQFSMATLRLTRPLNRLALAALPLGLSLLFTVAIIVLVGAPPLAVLQRMVDGAFGDDVRRGDVVAAWVPLTLCSLGLLLTFTAGLWNIGIEGQIVLG